MAWNGCGEIKEHGIRGERGSVMDIGEAWMFAWAGSGRERRARRRSRTHVVQLL